MSVDLKDLNSCIKYITKRKCDLPLDLNTSVIKFFIKEKIDVNKMHFLHAVTTLTRMPDTKNRKTWKQTKKYNGRQ